MKKLFAVAAVAALMFGGSTANAQNLRPLNSGPHIISGSLTMAQSTTKTCDVWFELWIDGSGYGEIRDGDFAEGDSGCGTGGLIWPQNFTWSPVTTGVSGGVKTVSFPVDVKSVLGRCQGTVTANFDGIADTLTLPVGTTVSGSQIIPPFSKSCTVSGVLDVPSPVDVL